MVLPELVGLSPVTVGTECFAALIETGLRAAPRHRIDAAHRRAEINGRILREERIVKLFVERLRELCRTTHIDIPPTTSCGTWSIWP